MEKEIINSFYDKLLGGVDKTENGYKVDIEKVINSMKSDGIHIYDMPIGKILSKSELSEEELDGYRKKNQKELDHYTHEFTDMMNRLILERMKNDGLLDCRRVEKKRNNRNKRKKRK